MANMNIVTHEELDKRLKGYDDNFKKLAALEAAHNGLQERLDELAAVIKDQPWSDEMEAILRKIAADRQANELRFERLTSRAAGGFAPSPVEIDALFENFKSRLTLVDSSAKFGERLDKFEKDYNGLTLWIKGFFGLDDDWTISSVFDGFTSRMNTLEGRLNASDERVTKVEDRVTTLEQDVAALKRKANFPLGLTVALFIIGGVVGWLLGLIIGPWVVSMIIGAIIGGIVGFAITVFRMRPRKARVNKTAQVIPGTNSNK
jgi:F0F1-type ATP synthase assembly protein I